MDYLLKSSACMAAFYGLYFFGFRRLTFHALNRFYLLTSLVLSLTIPMLNYEREEVVFLEPKPVSEISYSEENIPQVIDNQIVTSNTLPDKTEVFQINGEQVLGIIYMSGMAIMLLVFLRNIVIILRQIASATSASIGYRTVFDSLGYRRYLKITEYCSESVAERSGSPRFRRQQRRGNSSFFNYIFINPENLNPYEESLIIAHESFHAQLFHTLDLLLLGILKAVFWFNPIIYFYQKSLKQIHEYEVDALMSNVYDSHEYAHLLLKLGVAPNLLTINQFSTKPLSERIQFLFTKPTKNMKKLLYFLAIPLIGIGVMALAQENLKVVYKEGNSEKTIKSVEVKAYPLVIKDARNYATWTSGINDFDFSAENISLNRITAKNYNGFHYSVNPNSLTIKMIDEVNKYIGKRFLALVITEKELDSDGNLTKLGLAIKHLRTNQVTQTEVFDMKDLREKGKNGAFIFIEAYDKNFKESQMSINYGTKNLAITKSSHSQANHHAFFPINEISAIKHSSDLISYRVCPDKVSLETLEEVKEYFAKNGFDLKINNFKNGKKNQLEKIDLSFEKEHKSFIINDLRHLTKLKTEKNDKFHRTDESIIFEANTQTHETKIYAKNWLLDGIKKSDKWEIKDVVMNEFSSQIDSLRFTFEVSFGFGLTNTENFQVRADTLLLVESEDFFVKGNKVFLDPKYKKSKLYFQFHYDIGGNLLYPNLAKLEEIPYPKLNKVKNLPLAFLNKDSVNFPIRGIKEKRKFIY